jgi:hypothetical protein
MFQLPFPSFSLFFIFPFPFPFFSSSPSFLSVHLIHSAASLLTRAPRLVGAFVAPPCRLRPRPTSLRSPTRLLRPALPPPWAAASPSSLLPRRVAPRTAAAVRPPVRARLRAELAKLAWSRAEPLFSGSIAAEELHRACFPELWSWSRPRNARLGGLQLKLVLEPWEKPSQRVPEY